MFMPAMPRRPTSAWTMKMPAITQDITVMSTLIMGASTAAAARGCMANMMPYTTMTMTITTRRVRWSKRNSKASGTE